MQLHIAVVEVCGKLETCIADRIKRQRIVIVIDQIGVVFVNEIDGTIVKPLAVGDIGNAGTHVGWPIPDFARGVGRSGGMALGIQFLRVEPIPPLARAIGLSQLAIVWNTCHGAGRIGTLRHLVPHPRMRGVDANTEFQALGASGSGPSADQVFLRAEPDGVPGLILAIEVVEIVVVIRQGAKVLSTRPLIETHEFVRIPILSSPLVDHVLKSHLGRVPVVCQMELVIRLPFDIHLACVPVAIFGLALWPPVRPDAELGITVPRRRLVLLERFPSWLELALGHGFHLGTKRRDKLRGGVPGPCLRSQQCCGDRLQGLTSVHFGLVSFGTSKTILRNSLTHTSLDHVECDRVSVLLILA